jgi:hypothetical protein
MTNSKFNVPNLQITHFSDMAPNQYYSLYAGYLEGMYAGVGGEWMYRKWHSPFALGVDINRLQQRSFNQFFGFSNAGDQTGYRITTGHATAYIDTGWQNTHLKLSAGRYLAGDLGVTLDVGKTLDNGVSVGAWATKTNVSAQRFGEGSFEFVIFQLDHIVGIQAVPAGEILPVEQRPPGRLLGAANSSGDGPKAPREGQDRHHPAKEEGPTRRRHLQAPDGTGERR